MWALASALQSDRELVNQFLEGGYEPFAVTTNDPQSERIWFRKSSLREGEVEVHYEQPKPDKGTSRRSSKKPKS